MVRRPFLRGTSGQYKGSDTCSETWTYWAIPVDLPGLLVESSLWSFLRFLGLGRFLLDYTRCLGSLLLVEVLLLLTSLVSDISLLLTDNGTHHHAYEGAP
jgi:hypothetical protein